MHVKDRLLNYSGRMVSSLIVVLSLSGQLMKAQTQFDVTFDRLVVSTSLGLAKCPAPLSCDAYARQVNANFEFEIDDKAILARIGRELREVRATEADPFWVSMVVSGYKGNRKVFDLCTSHHFANGYAANGQRYAPNPELDSLLADALVKKIRKDEFRCLSELQDCMTEEASISLRLRDLKLLMNYLENRRYTTSREGSR